MKRTLALTLVVIASLAGCSSPDKPRPQGPATTTPAQGATTTPAPGATTKPAPGATTKPPRVDTGKPPVTGGWTPQQINKTVNECFQAASKASKVSKAKLQDYCTCAVSELQKTVSYEEAENLTKPGSETTENLKKLTAAITPCLPKLQ